MKANQELKKRVALMPQPQRWGEVLSKLNRLYNEEYISTESFSLIKCPALVLSGDRDDYQPVENIVRVPGL